MKILDHSVLVCEGSRLQNRTQDLAPDGVIVNSHLDSVPETLLRLTVRALRRGLWFQRGCGDEIMVNVWERYLLQIADRQDRVLAQIVGHVLSDLLRVGGAAELAAADVGDVAHGFTLGT